MALTLVTGGAGFIGSHVVRGLLEKGERVRVFDNFSSGKEENLKEIQGQVDVIKGDLTNETEINSALKGVDFVFHLAAIPSVQRSIEDPIRIYKANVLGTLNLLWAARKAGVKRFIYSSSSSAYGNQPTLPKEESMKPDPISPYASSKLAAEYDCAVFHAVYGVPTVMLRYFNVFGPRQDPASLYAAVIPRFISRLLKKEPPIVYGDGLQTRDFTYVEDVVRANLLACEASEKILGQCYNVACGQEITLLQLLDEMQKILKVKISPRFEPSQIGDVRASRASIEKARKAFGYEPTVSLKEGLKKTIAWFVSKENR
ncbi:MAG: SDR family oxidoreductase [Chlamydiae bacterium]|nr:SDR family oxidoreductase [Chlamydiota bacterium]MBI3266382.1 SDR family oxidoreductase [Chlamydiota bacterium]